MSYQIENSGSCSEDENAEKLTYLKEKELLGEKLQCAEQTIQEQSFKIWELEKCIRMELELDKYKALDSLWREHEAKLAEEKKEIREEKERSNLAGWLRREGAPARIKNLTAELKEEKGCFKTLQAPGECRIPW